MTFLSSDERLFVVAVSPSAGTKLVYELAQGATINLDYPDPGHSLWEDSILQRVAPLPPRIVVEGTLVQGRMWQEGESFTPTPQNELPAPPV